jgi:hypothetical protein
LTTIDRALEQLDEDARRPVLAAAGGRAGDQLDLTLRPPRWRGRVHVARNRQFLMPMPMRFAVSSMLA